MGSWTSQAKVDGIAFAVGGSVPSPGEGGEIVSQDVVRHDFRRAAFRWVLSVDGGLCLGGFCAFVAV